MALRRSAEDYLEAIYVLGQREGRVRSIDVAHHMDFSKPSVSRAVNQLKADGYLQAVEDGALVFTQKGRDTAEKIYERHTILTALLTGIGVPEEIAAEDACRVEHAISDETFACLKAVHQNRNAPKPEAEKRKKKKKKG